MNYSKQLMDFINNSPSPYHTVSNVSDMLDKAGFTKLDFTSTWKLENNKSYYTIPYGTTLFAFQTPQSLTNKSKIRFEAGHTDFPCFRIKPNAEQTEKGYLKLNTESYGGLIINTWLDRPLSIAGKVSLKSKDIFNPQTKLIDFKNPLLTIPNLAIHMNKTVNKGIELNKQTQTLPIVGMINEKLDKDNFFINMLADKLNVSKEDILDFDLYIYNTDKGCTLGINDDFISSPRLDNITSVIALTNAILASSKKELTNDINIIALYDNEEIGSRSKQGADSILTNILIEKIFASFDMIETKAYDAIMKGLLLSVDVAHGFHPNYSDKNDPTNIATLNSGVVLKIDSTQKYAFDTEAIAIVQQICDSKKIAYQKFVNRSDGTSGSTLGSISSSWLPMKTVDLGVPLLAMHSARELMGKNDQKSLNELCEIFFTL